MSSESTVSMRNLRSLSWGSFTRLIAMAMAVGLALGIASPAIAKTADGKTMLAFTSDVHNKSGNDSRDRLDGWIDAMCAKYGNAQNEAEIDYMGFCGDMGDANVTQSQFWEYAERAMTVVDNKISANKIAQACYTTGNHEFNPGQFNSITSSVKNRYTVDAVAPNVPADASYYLYCMGSHNDAQKNSGYEQDQISKLETFLGSCTDTSKPIFVMTHFPLHFLSRDNRFTANASSVIEKLNDAAGQGKTIVFIWGHNHSQSDPRYDNIYKPGTSIEYANGKSLTSNFYYLAAGCMSDSEYYGSSSVAGKGLVITVDDASHAMNLTYYGKNYEVVASLDVAGQTTPVSVTGVSLNTDALELTVGESNTLVATVAPSGATNKAVSWSSDDTSVAEVSDTGVVTAKAAGEATITVTTADGGKTATCKVTVAEQSISVTDFSLEEISLVFGEPGQTGQLTPKFTPADATNQKLTWASDDEGVATVDENGLVTAVGEGSCTITATTDDGGLSDTCMITVLKGEEPPVVGTGEWVRVKGSGRYQTMAAIVDKGFATSDWAVIANGNNFPDALVASSLAGYRDCPVILTDKAELSPEAEEKLVSLEVKRVYIMGGTGAVSQEVENAITDLDIRATRVKGAGRQATSLAAMKRISGYDTIVVATGGAFADALSIGPWCYAKSAPILLTDQGKLSDDQLAAIEAANPSRVIIVGGTGAVPQDVEDAIRDLGITVRRLKGSNRYETSKAIARFELSQAEGMGVTHAAVATGVNFPDALAGAALCGHANSVLALAADTDPEGDGVALAYVKSMNDEVVEGYVLGGTGAVSDDILDYLNEK